MDPRIGSNFGRLTYTDRMARGELMRQQTGQYGDIRDLPMFTAAGRMQEQDRLWAQMGGVGSYADAQMMAKMQQKANNWQAVGTIAKGIVDIGKFIAGFFV